MLEVLRLRVSGAGSLYGSEDGVSTIHDVTEGSNYGRVYNGRSLRPR